MSSISIETVNSIDLHIGMRLRAALSQPGNSVDRAAAILRMSPLDIDEYCHGRRRLSALHMFQICSEFSLAAHWFFDWHFATQTPLVSVPQRSKDEPV
jgi:hypothetical protein